MNNRPNKILTRTVIMLGFVSLFNDIGSEMLYPIMPVYLQTIGFSALWIGILEGIAEAVVGLSKGYFGKLSDEKGKRLPFVQLGYLLSAVSKPMIALFSYPLWILLVRSTDKLGKGIRTSARDAMLSDECSKENKGKIFGFHKAMDTIGASIGPILALLYLYYYPADYKNLFFIAFAPSILAVLFTFFVKENRKGYSEKTISKSNFFSYFRYWNTSEKEYRQLVVGLLLFALFNSSDVFLLLIAKHYEIADVQILSAYVFYNLVYAAFSYPMGHLADNIGMKNTYLLGMVLFSAVYIGMAFLNGLIMFYVLFFIYGIYAAATEGISKAWISKITLSGETATAIGFYASASSLVSLFASSLAGLIWVVVLPKTTFIISGVGALIASLYFLRTIKK